MQVDGEKQVIQPFSTPFQLECSFLNVAARMKRAILKENSRVTY